MHQIVKKHKLKPLVVSFDHGFFREQHMNNIEKTLKILDTILEGKTPRPGSYRGRRNNEPENNRKTLMDLKNAYRRR